MIILFISGFCYLNFLLLKYIILSHTKKLRTKFSNILWNYNNDTISLIFLLFELSFANMYNIVTFT